MDSTGHADGVNAFRRTFDGCAYSASPAPRVYAGRGSRHKQRGLRCYNHDYHAPSFYMITITTKDRYPFFATWSATNTLERTPDGYTMFEFWRAISAKYPQNETSTFVTMPDHIHGIVHVKETIPEHLGDIVRAFKSQVTSALRKAHNEASLIVWEPGYHDLCVWGKRSLAAFTNYVRDNPRRAALRRANPDLFIRTNNLSHPRLPVGNNWSGYGNLFLLDRPLLRSVRVSRSATRSQITEIVTQTLNAVSNGTTIISPFISSGEKTVIASIFDASTGDVILMNPYGFATCYKPPGRWFELCAKGRLLILSSHEYTGRKEPLTREVCLTMNEWCASIAATP